MKKILFLIHRFHYSGAAKAMQLIANGLAKTGEFDVTIATYSDTKPCYYVHPDIHVVSGKKRSRNKIMKYLEPIPVTRAMIKEVQPDLVVSFLNNASFYSLIAKMGMKCKVIVCERCDPYNEATRSLKFMRMFFGLSGGAVFQTEGAREYYKKLYDRSTVIPNIVDGNYKDIKVKPFAERKNEISIFSRLELKQKRHDVLLRAFATIHKEHPEIVLNIYGDGPDEDLLKKMSRDLNISDCVFFKGSTQNAMELLKDSKLTILTSDYEGIPNGVIDALAVGIPVVATDTSPGGVRLLIDDSYDGFIVPCGDAEKVAERAIQLLDDPVLADEFSARSKEINLRFSEETIIQRWKSYLNQI